MRINGSLCTGYIGFLPLYVTDPRKLSFRHIFPSAGEQKIPLWTNKEVTGKKKQKTTANANIWDQMPGS